MNELQQTYQEDVIPSLMKKFNYKSVMEVPKIEKIVINMGVGDAVQNAKALDSVVEELALISGQKPIITRAKKSIAGLRLRKGMPIGAKVTLRGERMYEFLQKLIAVALPRVRDFRGVSNKSFDGRGNYTLGVKEQLIFAEIDYDKVNKVRGMDIVIVTTSKTDEGARELMAGLGMPYKKEMLTTGGQIVARKSLIAKQGRPQKFKVREYTRCQRCGRPNSVIRKFKLCRVCFRELAHKGQIPGVKKASW